MKNNYNLNGGMRVSILTLFLILTAGFFNKTKSQTITLDGNRCANEWSNAAAFVDASSVTPGSADILKVWNTVIDTNMVFAILRESNGNSGFRLFFNTDCDTATGDQDYYRNGAEVAVWFNIQAGAVNVRDILNYNGSGYTSTSTTFDAHVGDSACTGTTKTFFEFAVNVWDLVDVCNIGDCGGITFTSAESVSGGSFNSNPVDTVAINAFAFINDRPFPTVVYDSAICSGETVTFDATGTSENNPGNETSYDDVTQYEWDYNFNGTFSVDATGSTYTTSAIISASSIGHVPVALRVTDVFGCQSIIDSMDINVYPNPTAGGTAVADQTYTICKDFDFNSTSVSWTGASLDHLWELPDGTTSTDITFSQSFALCILNYPDDGLVWLTVTDVNSGCTNTTPITPDLPVDLISFTGAVIGNDAHLKWQTASEVNSDYFVVERSMDGNTFTQITTVVAAGNSNSVLDYMVIDPNMPDGDVYYRLTQYDYNGDFEVFKSIVLNKENVEKGRIRISPNPGINQVSVELPASKENGEVVILDLAGKEVFKAEVSADRNARALDIDVSALPKGMYYVRFGNIKEGYISQMLQLI